MVKVYSNENPISVNHKKNILEASGITSIVKNENMQSVGVGAIGVC